MEPSVFRLHPWHHFIHEAQLALHGYVEIGILQLLPLQSTDNNNDKNTFQVKTITITNNYI